VKEIVVNELVRTQTIKNENTNDRWWNANSHREHEERGGNEKEKGFGFTKTMRMERVLVSRHITNLREEFSLQFFSLRR